MSTRFILAFLKPRYHIAENSQNQIARGHFMPSKSELSARFVETLTWKKAVLQLEREHRQRYANRVAKVAEDNVKRKQRGEPEQALPAFQPLKPPRQVQYLEKQQAKKLSLMLMLSYGGTIAWRAVTYRDKKAHYRPLGKYPDMTLEQARKAAKDYYKNRDQVAKEEGSGSFGDIAEKWFTRQVQGRGILTAPEIRRQLDIYVLPKWKDKQLVDIRRRHVSDLLDEIQDERGAAMADYVLSTIRGIMTWHQSRNDDYTSPIVKGMKRAEKKTEEDQHWLKDEEIVRLWQAAGESGPFGALVKMLLVTGQRKEKVTTMRHDDVVDGVWTIQRNSTREKGTAGKIKLPKLALDIIEQQPRIAGNPFVFAGSKGHFNGFGKAKRALDTKLGMAPGPDDNGKKGASGWVLHDLRRTCRKLMTRAQVRPDVAELALGHSIKGIQKIYDDRVEYEPLINDAFERVANEIERILNPSPTGNVVAMPARRS